MELALSTRCLQRRAASGTRPRVSRGVDYGKEWDQRWRDRDYCKGPGSQHQHQGPRAHFRRCTLPKSRSFSWNSSNTWPREVAQHLVSSSAHVICVYSDSQEVSVSRVVFSRDPSTQNSGQSERGHWPQRCRQTLACRSWTSPGIQ